MIILFRLSVMPGYEEAKMTAAKNFLSYLYFFTFSLKVRKPIMKTH